MRTLFLTNLYPYPLNSGGTIHSFTIIKALHQMGFEIDLLCFTESGEKENGLSKFVTSETLIPHKLTTAENMGLMKLKCAGSLFSTEPFIVYKFHSGKMRKALREKLDKVDYDLIYIDHLNLGIYISEIKKK